MKHRAKKLILLISFAFILPFVSKGFSDIDEIRARIISELLMSPFDDGYITHLISNIREDGSWPGINYEDVSRIRYEHKAHLSNLLVLSIGFRNPSSQHFKNRKIKSVFSSAIDFWIEHDFIADNWHTNEIANPRNWTAILFLMENEITKEQTLALVDMAGRANFNAWGARPGGDQIKIAGIAAELAAFLEDDETLKRAVDIMAKEIQISSGNGIKPDLAFHHRVDRVTSILSYGSGYAGAFADWAVRLAGTKFDFPEATTKLVIDFYLDGICKSMIHGWYKDPGSMNRGISRKGALEPLDPEIPEKLSRASDYRKDELENIIKIRKGKQKSNLIGNRFFWHSEYQSHQRPAYFTSVRMFSDRNHNMEYPHNMESLKMHHFADGSNFVSRTGKEYFDIFSVWDWQKIPGTTVVQKANLPSHQEIVKWGKTDFVGAVSDGVYGAATFDFDSPHDDLKAHKSWFFFDDEYVCLGAGIESRSGNPVVTTLNQCLLNEEVIVKSNHERLILKPGDHKMENTSWVFHDSIAYIFPIPIDVSLNNKSYQGRWEDISKSAWAVKENDVKKDLFSLWIDHGKKPENKSYEYLVRPAISEKEIDDYCKNSNIRVLINNSEIQAVQHAGLNLTQLVFYKAGSVEIAKDINVTLDQPGLIMIKSNDTKIEKISVADPTRKLNSFRLRVSTQFDGNGTDWKSKWDKNAGMSEIMVQLPQNGMAGKSVVLFRNKNYSNEVGQESIQKKEKSFEKPREDGKHYLGEKYGGGIIIWLDEKREHGLIAATEENNAEVPWENGQARVTEHYGDRNDRITNARRDGIGAGQLNTSLIVSQQTEDRFFGNFAAKVCVECKLGGYGDWYLPSKSELELMYDLKEEIGGFDKYMYWSSTEYNVGFAWGQSFNHYKSEYTFNKGSRCAVRCIRKF